MNIIGHKKIFLTSSGLLVLLGILAVSAFGFREGIDFAGGTLWSLEFKDGASLAEVKSFFSETLKKEIVATADSAGAYQARLESISEEDHQKFLSALREKFGEVNELSFQSIGPSIGAELRRNALIAVLLVLIGISAYIAFAFRKISAPVASWKYGAVTLITLLHDIAIPAGMFAVLSHYLGVEGDTNFIVALLVVMGFSVHDTIVVFDRIRENLLRAKSRENLSEIVNQSVNETFARSVNTSLTLVIMLVGLYVLGPETLRYFILTILVGVLAGTYSSIFVASPLLTVWHNWSRRGAKKR